MDLAENAAVMKHELLPGGELPLTFFASKTSEVVHLFSCPAHPVCRMNAASAFCAARCELPEKEKWSVKQASEDSEVPKPVPKILPKPIFFLLRLLPFTRVTGRCNRSHITLDPSRVRLRIRLQACKVNSLVTKLCVATTHDRQPTRRLN